MKISELSPNVVWKQFEEILKVPRPSKHEEKMVEFLVNFANEHNLKYTVDETQNVIIKKSATKGYENKKKIPYRLFGHISDCYPILRCC